MEKPQKKEIGPPPEKNYSYYVEHPDEVTLEDIERIEEGGMYSFLNNFHRHVLRKDPGIDEAIEETGFDFERFNKLSGERRLIISEYYAFLNKHRDPTPEEAARLSEIKILHTSLNNEIEPMLLNLYKAMRRLGYKHYPDLTA